MSFIKNKSCSDYTDTCKQVYITLIEKYGYTIRISNIWQLLADSIGINKFEILEPKVYQNGSFESYLIARQIDWQNGKDVNFDDILDAIISTGDFTGSERMLLNSGDIEERLWGIYLAITDKTLNFN